MNTNIFRYFKDLTASGTQKETNGMHCYDRKSRKMGKLYQELSLHESTFEIFRQCVLASTPKVYELSTLRNLKSLTTCTTSNGFSLGKIPLSKSQK